MRGRRQRYTRRGPVREPYDVVLIVCEGTKTEPYYFDNFIKHYKLSSVNIRVIRPPRHDPAGIVEFAIGELGRDQEIDRAYCVFDRNGHATYIAALDRITRSAYGRARKLIAVVSKPCFEVWLLLHYRYSNAPHVAVGGASACDLAVSELRRHFPAYAKGHQSIFNVLLPQLDTAIQNAARLEAHNIATI
jgi:hypothetical protein